MTNEDLEAVVRRYYRTVDSPTPIDVVELFSEDAIYRRPGYRPMVGRSALTEFYAGERVIADGEHELVCVVIGDAHHAAVEGLFRGHLRDGTTVALGFADFFTIRDDVIIERNTYFEAPAV